MGKTLLILGNGFDLNIGLATSYKDFIEETYKGIIKEITPFIEETNGDDIEYIYQKIIEDRHKNNLPENINRLILYLLIRYEEIGWIDVERSLRDYALSYNNKPTEKDRDIKGEFDKLCRDLWVYMSGFKYPSDKYDSFSKFHYDAKSIAVRVLKAVSDLGNAKIYSFNYTNMGAAIDSLNGDGCSLNKKDIVYIHGMVTSSYDSRNIPIILGIDNKADVKSDFNCMIKPANPLYNGGIIGDLSDAEHVVFFGFGLGITDFPYFEKFFNDILTGNNPKVKISVFDVNNANFSRQIDIITGKNIHLLREKCDLKTYNASNISDKEFKEFQSRLQ